MKRQQEGFTLIELVMVIVILGILAAFALPRFADLGGDARTAAVQGIGSNIKSAAAIVHSAALVKGVASAASGTVTLEGQTINLVYGYPGAGTDIMSASQFDPDPNDYTKTAAATSTTWDRAGAPGTCQVVYNEASSATSPATVNVTTSGCK